MELLPRFYSPPEQSHFLFGPRGTGKSAWTQMYYKNAARLDLLQPDVLRRYQGNPERIRDFVHARPNGQAIIVDEVQRVPELLSAVHAPIEEKRGWKFVLIGSSARKLKQTGVDLMAGRALVRTLHPFMAEERACPALEGLVGQHLRAWNAYSGDNNRDEYPEAELLLLYGGDEMLRIDGIQCMPCQAFLKQLIPGRALPG